MTNIPLPLLEYMVKRGLKYRPITSLITLRHYITDSDPFWGLLSKSAAISIEVGNKLELILGSFQLYQMNQEELNQLRSAELQYPTYFHLTYNPKPKKRGWIRVRRRKISRELVYPRTLKRRSNLTAKAESSTHAEDQSSYHKSV